MKLISTLLIIVICTEGNGLRKTYSHMLQQKHRRIIDGAETFPDKYPLAVNFMWESSNGNSETPVCGAAIVHKYWALTAAHCVATSYMHFLVGLKRTFLRGNTSFINGPNSNNHRVEFIIAPQGYTTYSGNQYNIALLKVTQPFIGIYEAPIPIATKDYQYVDGSTAFLLGWGYVDKAMTMQSWVLRVSDIKLMNLEKCRNKYNWYHYQNGGLLKIFVTDLTVCAWSRNKGPCIGDDGGPVIQNGKLIGILSMHGECASDYFPSVYTKTSVFYDWVQDQIKMYPEKRNGKIL